jgi:putative PIN family toxin of toxin-antitoxin system
VLRVLLDTNVIVSAAIRPSGPPGRVVTAALGRSEYQLVLSPAIIAEARAAFGLPRVRRYLREPDEVGAWLADLAAVADLVGDTGRVAGVCRDPADELVLAAALEGRAALIVTGDDDLLAFGEHEGIPILTPRAFLALLDR